MGHAKTRPGATDPVQFSQANKLMEGFLGQAVHTYRQTNINSAPIAPIRKERRGSNR